MGTLLMYRDLPGGPTKVKFADEISRHCLCGRCGMLSLSMFHDPGGHMFCETCLNEQSTKHGRFDIYCSYEGKNIDINEMFEARDLINIIRDQYVDCPNQQNCKRKVQLQNLPDHYVLCKQHVQCNSCAQNIETSKWKDHICAFKSLQAITEAAEKSSASEKTVKERGHQEEHKTLVLRSHDPPASRQIASQEYADLQSAAKPKYSREPRREETDAAAIEPRHQVMSAQCGAAAPMQHSEAENDGPALMQICHFCERNVKQSNMPRHREKCAKAPKPCVYCEQQFYPLNMPSHIQECHCNPDNITRERETRRSLVTVTSQPTSHGAVAGNLHETSQPTLRDQLQMPNSRCYEAAAAEAVPDPIDHFSAHSAFHFDRDTNLGGTLTWFEYMASGDWLSAFVAMEESFRTQRTEEECRYAQLALAVVSLNQYTCVQDFLAQPSQVQPSDCLLAALFVRAYLPRNVWPRTEEVTWMQALQYVPNFLASRLCEEAVAYLFAYPVFPEGIGSLPVDENQSCPTERQSGSNAEPVTPEESTSRTSVKTLQGEKKAGTETPESVLREEAAASALFGKKHSGPLKDESSSKPCDFVSDVLAYKMNTLHTSAHLQEDTEKLSVESKSDDRARGEDADCTVYLNVPATSNTDTSEQTRSNSHRMSFASALSNTQLLYSVLRGSSRQQRGLLLNASQSDPLQQILTYKNLTPHSSIMDSNECTPALDEINSTMLTGTSSADSTAGNRQYPSTEWPLRRNDYSESCSGGKAEFRITCRELADSMKEGTSTEYATFTQTERSDGRSLLHQLCKRGPYCECRSTAPVPKECLGTETGTGSRAERLKQYSGRSRRVPDQEQSPALNENPWLTRIRGLGRGFQTSKNRMPLDATFGRTGEALQYALHVDEVREQNFQDVENVDE